MSLAAALKHIYPDIDLEAGVVLRDNGNGPFIEFWNDQRQQPTEQQIEAAEAAARISAIECQLDEIASNKVAAIFGFSGKSLDLVIKELNYSNRCNELLNFQMNRDLTPTEQTELDLLNSYWARVKAIRSYEKSRVVELQTANVDTFNVNAGWPE